MSVSSSPSRSPVFTRLRHTPLRDLLRGRLTGRLDVERAITRHGFPSVIEGCLRSVVRQTRLWRSERVDVADELAAHFADGLDAGVDPEDLARRFGDLRRVARLIRRAKRRQRPLPWKFLRWSGLAGVALFACYLLLGIRFMLGRPAPPIDYRPLASAAAAAVPATDRAWPHYRAALLEMERPEEIIHTYNRAPHPDEDGWELVRVYLERHQSSLASVRAAAARPGLGFVARSEITAADRALWPDTQPISTTTDPMDPEMLFSVLMPHLSELRQLARTLAWDTRRAAAEGDGVTAVANIEAIIGMTRHAREMPFIINDLVAFAILTSACEAAGDVVARTPTALTDAQLVNLAHRIAATDELLTMRLDGERLGFEDLVQRSYTDNGRGNGRFTRQGLQLLGMLTASGDETERVLVLSALPLVGLIVPDRREMLATYHDLMDTFEREARTPLWEREHSAEDTVEAWHGSLFDTVRYLPLVLTMPALGKAAVQRDLTTTRRDAALVGIALELERRSIGVWPADLADLVPHRLPTLPRDPFDGHALRYTLVNGAPRVYSVGTNRTDDDGVEEVRPGRDHASRWMTQAQLDASRARGGWHAPPAGDWILWPPRRRPLTRDDA
ncbi:MAG: hypothetical protein HKN62_09160 [Phycisphaerales bacterium]|nr:hypothetical protein [Phycisphaerales bacterium]